MKHNSFVASGYKYGLVSFPEEVIGKSILKSLFKESENGLSSVDAERTTIIYSSDFDKIIPFENVDGLELHELAYSDLLYKRKYLVFAMYDALPLCSKTVDEYGIDEYSAPENSGYFRYIYLIDKEKHRDDTIDDVIGEHLISNMDRLCLSNRRRALGFLEKYIGGSKSDTNMIINNYLKRHRSEYGDYYEPAPKYTKIPDRLFTK